MQLGENEILNQLERIRAQGKLTIRDGRGKDYDFHASSEILQDIKIGDTIKAKLKEAPKCPEK